MQDHCVGKTSGGKGVDQGLSQLGQMLGKLMEALKGGGGAGGGAPAPAPTTPLTGCQGLPFQTSDPSQLSNPCAQYTAPTTPFTPIDFNTGTSSTCDALSQALGTCGSQNNCPAVAANCGPGYTEVPQPGRDANNCPLPNQCAYSNSQAGLSANLGTTVAGILCNASGKLLGLCGGSATSGPNLSGLGTSTGLSALPQFGGGLTGNIFLTPGGVTIVANSQNTGNTTVAGFYGSNTLGTQQPQGLAARMCQNRPWSGFLSALIPPSFFDGLCSWQGYQVGTSTPQQTVPVVEVQQTKPSPVTKPTTPPPTPAVATSTAQVKIWAVPATVALNTRTSIFWSAQGVTQCTESSPDGSFNQSSLSGGAATVPLVSATTFTISCLDSAGNPVTGYVTVNLSL
jgi:hypothetical protein